MRRRLRPMRAQADVRRHGGHRHRVGEVANGNADGAAAVARGDRAGGCGAGVGSLRRRLPREPPRRRRGKPRRIVSLDLCTDQLLVELVPRERIAAVTHLAGRSGGVGDPREGARHPHHARRRPRTCCATIPTWCWPGPFGVSATVDLLRRLGRNVVVVPLPHDLEGVRAAVRTVAAAVGEEAKGEALIADFDRRLASARRRCGARAAHGRHLPGRRHGLGPRQPGRCRARRRRLSQHGGATIA